MFENLSDKPVAEYQAEQIKKWNEMDMLNLCVNQKFLSFYLSLYFLFALFLYVFLVFFC